MYILLAMGLTRIISIQTRVKKFKYLSKEKDVSKKLCNPSNPIASKSSN